MAPTEGDTQVFPRSVPSTPGGAASKKGEQTMKRMLAITCAGALLLALTSCSGGEKEPASSSAGGSSSSISSSASSSGGDMSSAGSSASASQQETESVSLYIGRDGDFYVYTQEISGEVTPESIIQSMTELTGWNLDVVSAVEGNGKIVVSFAETSALYVGPPQEQKEEFHVLDARQLDQAILDSIKRTLEKWVGTEDGTVEVYFTAADGGDLVLEDIGVTISADEAYTAFPSGEAQ